MGSSCIISKGKVWVFWEENIQWFTNIQGDTKNDWNFHVLSDWNTGKKVSFPSFLEGGFLFILKIEKLNYTGDYKCTHIILCIMIDYVWYKPMFYFFSLLIVLSFSLCPFYSSGKV